MKKHNFVKLIKNIIKEETLKLSNGDTIQKPISNISKINGLSADDFLKHIGDWMQWDWQYRNSPATYKGSGTHQSFSKTQNKNYEDSEIEIITLKGKKFTVKKGGKVVLTGKMNDKGLANKIYGAIK